MRRPIARLLFWYYSSTRLKSGQVLYWGIFLFWESAIEKGVTKRDSLKQGLIYSILSKTVRIAVLNGRGSREEGKKILRGNSQPVYITPHPTKTEQKGVLLQ